MNPEGIQNALTVCGGGDTSSKPSYARRGKILLER